MGNVKTVLAYTLAPIGLGALGYYLGDIAGEHVLGPISDWAHHFLDETLYHSQAEWSEVSKYIIAKNKFEGEVYGAIIGFVSGLKMANSLS